MASAPIAALRRFVHSAEPAEKCDMCGEVLTADHGHTFETIARRLRCACPSCEILYANVYKVVPREVRILHDFRMTDAQWDELLIPISLAFFNYSTPVGRVIAQYPGPAGATESLLRLDAWAALAAQNPLLRAMQPDVEALLINRVGASREYFIAPIDECYRLVGVIRLHWRGLCGGAIVWGEIAKFFDSLRRKGVVCQV